MQKKLSCNFILMGLLISLLQMPLVTRIYSQQTDTLRSKNLYRPEQPDIRDTIPIPAMDSSRQQAIRDSILLRLQFVRDSILVREQFIKDSIQRRQRILDSLGFLQRELPVLFESWFRTVKEDIIISTGEINLVGDSVLGNYEYGILPFSVSEPFTPWKTSVALTDKVFRYGVDKKTGKISTIQTSFMRCSFAYDNRQGVLVINERSYVQKHWSGQYYKTPVDSVFFDRNKRIVKIKRYVQFYGLVNNNQQGAPLFLNLSQVFQYEYGPDNQLMQYQVVRFCDRWKVYDPVKVCSIITYSLQKKDNGFLLTRRNDPPNTYSDGTFLYDFDANGNLQQMSFHNLSNTENWERVVELNKEGNVNCYYDKKNNVILQSLCMVYKDPKAKYPVETITTTFEKDGISYYQINNTTGQARTRDKMTLEWSAWK